MDDNALRNLARRRLIQELEAWQLAGVTSIPRAAPAVVSAASAPPNHSATAEPSEEVSPPMSKPATRQESSLFDQPDETAAPLSLEERRHQLQVLQDEVADCQRCEELAGTRTQTVFGVGSPQARLCFLGEAPGADEDRLGEPFVGRAGQLLTKIIQACQMQREDVYILNVLKCRPPGNRNPLPDEAANCERFLERQLDIIRPEYICCLGSVAAQNLLGTKQAIGRMRGTFYSYRGIKVLVTYHPAYLLRNPAAKKQVWEDMQLLMREMGLPLP